MSATSALATLCPACGHDDREEFFDLGRLPVFANVLHGTPEEALAAPRAPIRLAWCPACGHIGNLDHDPGLVAYGPGYENALHFSPRFAEYAEDLAHRLADRHGLRGRDVVEIGCGDGHFLALLCAVGGNRGLGFDPAFDPARAARPYRGRMSVVAAPFPEEPGSLDADLVCCRHLLEHVPHPLEFLRRLRRAVGDRPGTALYFEVPNALHMLEQDGLWDVIYEHCSYFVPRALEGLLLRAGFAPTEVSTGFGGQFLSIEARPAAPVEPGPEREPELATLVLSFARRQRAKLARWRERLRELAREGARVVVWGAGSKGATFLNALRVAPAVIGEIVDVNPRKHGRFVPGTGQEVVPPERLREIRPDAVVLLNPAYRREVAGMLGELWLGPDLIAA